MDRVAATYAAQHPERVSHLLLWNCYAKGADVYVLPKIAALVQIRDTDFDTWAHALGQASVGWANAELGAYVARILRESADWETIPRALGPTRDVDLTEAMAKIEAPTLVMYRGDSLWGDTGLARALASGIAGSQLRSFPGDISTPSADSEDVLAAIIEFVPPGAAPAAPKAEPALVKTIVFTDVEASTDLTDRFGDARARDLLREHEAVTREALANNGGTEIKTMGDGFMASFASASGALDAAIAMQRSMAAHFADSATPIRIRIGINAGEPIAEDNDLYGTAVIRAARIMGQADGGEILASDLVRGLVAGKDYLFEDRGEAALKGFEEPVRLFGVRWQQDS